MVQRIVSSTSLKRSGFSCGSSCAVTNTGAKPLAAMQDLTRERNRLGFPVLRNEAPDHRAVDTAAYVASWLSSSCRRELQPLSTCRQKAGDAPPRDCGRLQ